MRTAQLLSGAALLVVLLFSGGTAFAQTATSTGGTGTGSTDTSGTGTGGTGTTVTPGTPNTGAGGDATTNALILVASALAVALGGMYLARSTA
jgi:ABC-type transport system substrate-binding protein